MALPDVWGATEAEVRRRYPADDLLAGDGPGDVRTLTRAIDVDAPRPVTWRWLCQVAVAPYSYDWIDNRGRRSPQELTPGADELRVGQPMAVVFRLTSFQAPHQWTAVTTARGERLFGPVAMTFAAEPRGGSDRSRIVCRLVIRPTGVLSRARAEALAWGDLVMMRRQLRNLRRLAERDARRAAWADRPSRALGDA